MLNLCHANWIVAMLCVLLIISSLCVCLSLFATRAKIFTILFTILLLSLIYFQPFSFVSYAFFLNFAASSLPAVALPLE